MPDAKRIFDIVIVGGGYAGLSAASGIVRQDHTTLLVDSKKYRNDKSEIHTVPTWDHRRPEEFRAQARKDLERYGTVSIEYADVEWVKQVASNFEITARDKTWTGRKLILAVGVEDIMLDIPGYKDCWVSGIFHCLYCHGWEERGAKSSGMLAVGDTEVAVVALHFARQGLRLSESVTLYTHGNTQLASDIEAAIKEAGKPAPMTVDSRKITKLVKGDKGSDIVLHFEDGSQRTEGWLAHKPNTRIRGTEQKDGTLKGDLVAQLELPVIRGAVKVSPPFNQTDVRGVFAAGDMASPMQTVTGALASGTATGGGAPLQIQAEDLNQKPIF